LRKNPPKYGRAMTDTNGAGPVFGLARFSADIFGAKDGMTADNFRRNQIST
jgi:hypothetical protein